MLVGAIIQGVAGFGLAVLASPTLFLLEPDLVPGPVLLAAILHTVLSAAREREHIQFSLVSFLFFGTVPGILAGVTVSSLLDTKGISILLGFVILLAVIVTIFGRPIPRNRFSAISTGLMAGFSGSTTAVAGPHIALFLSGISGSRLRSTMAAYFMISGSLSLTALAVAGEFTAQSFGYGLLLMPFVGAGFALSSPLRQFVDKDRLRWAVLLLSSSAAITLLIRSFL